MGAGDVKLALGLGALTGCFGADVWLLAAIGAPLLTVVVGIVARICWSATTVPHGPSMCVASVAAIGWRCCHDRLAASGSAVTRVGSGSRRTIWA